MESEFTQYLPDVVARDFRALMLGQFSDSAEWRLRRIDRFESIDWDSFSQEVTIDMRVRRQTVRRVLEDLGRRYERRGWVELKDGIDAILADPDLRPPGCATAWTHLDLVIPALWVPGPLVGLRIECESREVVPFVRRDAAAAYRFVGARLLRVAGELGFAPTDRHAVSGDLAQLLVAFDAPAIVAHPSLSRLKTPLDSPGNWALLQEWMSADLRRMGFPERSIAEGMTSHANRLRAILMAAEFNRMRLAGSGARDYLTPTAAPAHTACLNPLLLFHSYCKLQLTRAGGADFSRRSGRRFLLQFLRLAEYWQKTVSLLADAVAAGVVGGAGAADDDARFAILLVRTLFQVTDNWPLLVRVRVPVEQAFRARISQVIVAPALSRSWNRVGRSNESPIRSGLGLLRRPASLLWSLITRFADGIARRLGKRPILRSQYGSQAYPLVLHDALSTHVEVVCQRSELLLLPRSAIVKIPKAHAPNSVALRLLRWPLLRSFAPRLMMGAPEVFGRCSDEGQRVQHFYTTKSRSENPWILSGNPEAELPGDGAGQPSLVVRYRIPGHVWIANHLATVLAAIIAGLLLFTALVDMCSLTPLPVRGGFDFPQIALLSVPAFLGVLLLFAFEKHTDLLVAEELGRNSHVVIVSFIVGLGSAVIRLLALRPSGIPMPVTPEQSVQLRGFVSAVVSVGWSMRGAAISLLLVWAVLALGPVVAWSLTWGLGNKYDDWIRRRQNRRGDGGA